MTQFKSQSDLVRDKLDENADAITAAERDAADSPEAAIKLVQLQARRRQLEQEARQAQQDERDRAAEAARRAAEASARAGEQHAGRYRRECAAVQAAIGDLAQHYKEAKSALASLVAVAGSAPGLSIAELQHGIDVELFRVSAQPSHFGERSELVKAPPGVVGAASRLPSLSDTIGRATRHATAAFRARLGLAGRMNAAPTDNTGAGE